MLSGEMADQAARYRAARGWANLTQEQLAEKLGVDAQTIKRRESPRDENLRGANRGELIAVAHICDVPLNFMLYGWSPDTVASAPRPKEVEELMDEMKSLTRVAEELLGKLGRNVGRRDLESRRAKDRRARAASADASGTPLR